MIDMILISKKEFNDAIDKAIEEIFADEKMTNSEKAVIPIVGALFANRIREILFSVKRDKRREKKDGNSCFNIR